MSAACFSLGLHLVGFPVGIPPSISEIFSFPLTSELSEIPTQYREFPTQYPRYISELHFRFRSVSYACNGHPLQVIGYAIFVRPMTSIFGTGYISKQNKSITFISMEVLLQLVVCLEG